MWDYIDSVRLQRKKFFKILQKLTEVGCHEKCDEADVRFKEDTRFLEICKEKFYSRTVDCDFVKLSFCKL